MFKLIAFPIIFQTFLSLIILPDMMMVMMISRGDVIHHTTWYITNHKWWRHNIRRLYLLKVVMKRPTTTIINAYGFYEAHHLRHSIFERIWYIHKDNEGTQR